MAWDCSCLICFHYNQLVALCFAELPKPAWSDWKAPGSTGCPQGIRPGGHAGLRDFVAKAVFQFCELASFFPCLGRGKWRLRLVVKETFVSYSSGETNCTLEWGVSRDSAVNLYRKTYTDIWQKHSSVGYTPLAALLWGNICCPCPKRCCRSHGGGSVRFPRGAHRPWRGGRAQAAHSGARNRRAPALQGKKGGLLICLFPATLYLFIYLFTAQEALAPLADQALECTQTSCSPRAHGLCPHLWSENLSAPQVREHITQVPLRE